MSGIGAYKSSDEAPLYRLLFGILSSTWERNLKSARPSLILFDLWRLGVTRELDKKKTP